MMICRLVILQGNMVIESFTFKVVVNWPICILWQTLHFVEKVVLEDLVGGCRIDCCSVLIYKVCARDRQNDPLENGKLW